MSGVSSSSITGPFGTLRWEREVIEFTSNAPRRDPDWEHTDKRGHVHRVVESASPDAAWPSLKWVVDRTYYCEDCRDEHEDGHWECRRCGEHVEPGMLPASPEVQFAFGPKNFYLDDEPVSEAEFERIAAEAAAGEA